MRIPRPNHVSKSALPYVEYVASRRISAGDEIIIDYGEAYFKRKPELVAAGFLYECGTSDIHVASGRGDVGTVHALLSRTASTTNLVNQASSLPLARTPLMEAVLGAHQDVALLLLQEGADANSVDEEGYTALHIASELGYAHVAQLLLENGADANLFNAKCPAPLIMASYHGHLDLVNILASHGAKVNFAMANLDGSGTRSTPLIVASHEGHLEVVHALIRHGADVNLAQAGSGTPLIRASHAGHLEVIEALISHGADVNRASDDGATALMAAAVSGDMRTAKLLLSKGANPHTKVLGQSVLSVAVDLGHMRVASLLSAALAKTLQGRNKGQDAGTHPVHGPPT